MGTLAIECYKGGPSDGRPDGRVLTTVYVCEAHAQEAISEGPVACFENGAVAQVALERMDDRFGPSPDGWALRVVVMPVGDPGVRRVEAALAAAAEAIFQRTEWVH